MENDSKDNMLFQDFTPPTRQEWLDKVTVDLKGANFDKKLVWKNLNGINIQPFYTKNDQVNTLANTGENSPAVTNYRRITVTDVKEANRLALKALEEGMSGILFEITSEVLADQLLKDIDYDGISISFILSTESISFAAAYLAFLEKNQIEADKVQGYIDLQLFDAYLYSGTLDKGKFELLSKLTRQFSQYPGLKTLVVSGSRYQDAGSNQIQEIAFTLNSMVFLIEEMTDKGLSEAVVFENLQFVLGLSGEYFIEIAKLRVFNSLVAQIGDKYGVSANNISLLSKTSTWSKSVTDANTNMLRSTTEAMAALLGNTDAIEIDPYDQEFKESNDFSSRIAGNIATILKEESYFGKVMNPVDGSYYIEELSLKLAENALEVFKNIEALGGFYKQFENEQIQAQIAAVRIKKIQLISQRRLAMVGVNKYPNLMEEISKDILANNSAVKQSKCLLPHRAGMEIEKIRYATESFVKDHGFRPRVELVSFGQLTMRKARAAFAYDFMGVSGYEIESEKSYESADAAARESAASKSDVVVFCSSDPDYLESAVDFVREFRSINQSKILLLAGNPAQISDELRATGLDDFIHVRSNIFDTLTGIQNKISKTIKPLEI
ncbi:methylmalonyl-CoA mutase family protein [Lutimonas sp.]|uniref:methylmalonyl-CoA mutase family protein n=1 Tax=Lutimonas sp. TaxID=1872403 RepID=UPI003D9B4724